MVGVWNGVSPQVTELGQVTGLSERLDTLVHESAGGCPLMRARHSHFMRLHLLMPVCASIAAPLVLAIAGTPTPWQAAAFGLAMLPLAGVALASQRGALDDAQAIGLAALAGLACVAGVAAGPGFAAGLFLCLLPFEAALAGTARALRTACVAAAGLGFLLLLASATGVIPAAGAAPLADAALGACALVYGLGLAQVARAQMLMRAALHDRERAEHRLLRALVSDVDLQFNRAGIVLSNRSAGHPGPRSSSPHRNCPARGGAASRRSSGGRRIGMTSKLPPHRDIRLRADLLVAPRPALAGVLKDDPDEIVLDAIINEDMGQSRPLGRRDRQRRVEPKHHRSPGSCSIVFPALNRAIRRASRLSASS